MIRRFLLLLASLAVLAGAGAQEGAAQRLVFERWALDTFFNGYKAAGYAQRWDVPATANEAHGGLPVAILLARQDAPLELGDALRQYEIDEPFILLVGFWQQAGDTRRVVNIVATEIRPETWRRLWGAVTYSELLRLDALIKDPGLPPEELRRLALKTKNAPPFADATLQVNPRIGADGQRRLLCSIRFDDFFKLLAPGADPAPRERPALWDVEYPGPVAAPAPRTN